MTYDEIADGIACKRWAACTQIKMDVELLRGPRVRVSLGERRFFGVLGFSIMAYAEFVNSLTSLSVGMAFVWLAVIGVLDQRRRDRVRVWFDGVAG